VAKKSRKKYFRDDAFLKNLGLRIRQLRMEKKMSQEDLAFEYDYADFSQINRIELGKVNFSVSYIRLIANALDEPIASFFEF